MSSQLESNCIYLKSTLFISSSFVPTKPIPTLFQFNQHIYHHHLLYQLHILPLNVTTLMMVTELGLSFLAQFTRSNQVQTQFLICSLMWNNSKQMPQGGKNDDESWEVRAFEEDTTGNLLGCTWPPRSYTCTFCRREFRSAQALGGHMNVHRRDRARLHHEAPPPLVPPSPTAAVFIPAGQELVGNGLCLLYPLHNPNPNNTDFPCPLLPILPLVASKPNDRAANNSVVSSLCHSGNMELHSPSNSNDNMNKHVKDENEEMEELDLELRLGRKWHPPGER